MLYEAESGDLTVVASGDTMITRRLSVFREPSFVSLVELFRNADVGYTNLEMLFHEFEHPPGSGGGTYTASEPLNLEELKWAGINLVSTANNHSYDYGHGGVLTNLKNLRAVDLAHAGTGVNLSEARAPGYLDTPKGRVALISVSSTFPDGGRALDQRPDSMGRPGLNALRFTSTHTVDRKAFDHIKRANRELGFEAVNSALRRFRPAGAIIDDTDAQMGFLGAKFVLGEEFKTSTEPNPRDMEENLKWIREARRMADWVFVGFHCHESGVVPEEPPEFLVTFAHACIDEGADGFFGHGPHFTRGIEIYHGKPIFYSLGNFIFQNETVRWQPSVNYEMVHLDHQATPADFYDARTEKGSRGFPGDPVYWESVVARCEFQNGGLSRISLHPIDLGHGRPRSQRGRPTLAKGTSARKSLERLRKLSRPFGVDLKVDDGVGFVNP